MLPVLRMKVEKPSHYKIGDKVHIPIGEETYTATAIRREADGNMLFVMDNLLETKKYIDKRDSIFDWEHCSLRVYLQKLYEHLPNKKIKNQIVPFENGDFFRIPYIKDCKGDQAIFHQKSERIKTKKVSQTACGYWLADASKTDACFYYVDYDGVVCDSYGDVPYVKYGVLILFKLKDNLGNGK